MKCRWATLHWIRFVDIETPESLELATSPIGAASWKIGPDGPVGPAGTRLPSSIWCAVGLYPQRTDAECLLDDPAPSMPFLSRALESWHAMLKPLTHKGECNHLDRETPGELFALDGIDPGGSMVVITTAGYRMGPGLDVNRVIDFRRNVDTVRERLREVEGNIDIQVFTPHTPGDDGVTSSIWRTDAAMVAAAYRPGAHRERIDRHRNEEMADRTSFTRFRAVRTAGTWRGRDPIHQGKT
jgi:heme-degrading monooxygenase HmoA